jgi:hypothetical protein
MGGLAKEEDGRHASQKVGVKEVDSEKDGWEVGVSDEEGNQCGWEDSLKGGQEAV